MRRKSSARQIFLWDIDRTGHSGTLSPEEGDAAIADLFAAGASPDDLFIRLVPLGPDPTSAMHENYRWEGRAGYGKTVGPISSRRTREFNCKKFDKKK